MKLTEKINFRQPKYMLPAILYLPLVFCGFFVLRLFDTEKVETSTAETTEYYNDKLPDANIKGDGIGDKYTNMLNDLVKLRTSLPLRTSKETMMISRKITNHSIQMQRLPLWIKAVNRRRTLWRD